jgi:hypothetical protein
MLTLFTFLVPLLGSIPAAQGLLGKLEVGKLPALGWNSWNAYDCNISEEKFLSAAQKLVDLGLKVGLSCKFNHTSLHLTYFRMLVINMLISMTVGPLWTAMPKQNDYFLTSQNFLRA